MSAWQHINNVKFICTARKEKFPKTSLTGKNGKKIQDEQQKKVPGWTDMQYMFVLNLKDYNR